ncbi:glycoside hydrolase family 31 protein [Arsenicicoccus piscis]|uniref:glycoside hydrolase family 31 protein n=1 Tax=Arsenicicoccus piscis TaxID=673954 RepID=UPI001F4CEDF1|nr:glycoside hydrolase family 31 protein [Arsenicicoccus piscis]
MTESAPSSPARRDGIAQVTGETYRITVLNSAVVRLEQSPTGSFEDRPTQVVLMRDLPANPVAGQEDSTGQVQVHETGDLVEIVTDDLHLTYDRRPFRTQGLSVQVRGGVSSYRSVWRYGLPAPTLGGTARTLDEVDGRTDLEPGILSRNGFAVLDDSASLVVPEPGRFEPRPPGSVDLYVFAHGRDYRRALRDFYALTGSPPLVPRYVLGNWWSRYHAYSADEYLELMDTFAQQGIPFSVAVLDMDWHEVDIPPRFGSGWTGYTWAKRLFPDPPAFLAALHERGLRVTLNDHPADGVRAHEDAYPTMAAALGVDPATEHPLTFEASDEAYLRALFDHVLHPMERDGVDFWWIDWQQGASSRIPGLDPLWALNDRHLREMASTGRRPVIFSRYAGPGSHRTPVGFSGDTVVSWASLAFQPEFTATASNIGYGWWSHDIGGHMFGTKDDELATRWAQLGTFSPVNRLHSTSNPFNSKEPWRFGPAAERAQVAALRLRHRLLPYLYTMAERASAQGHPLVEPLYHEHPWAEEAYRRPNEFAFGEAILVAPVTTPIDPRSIVARTDAWLPDGTWFDLQTGWRYDGGRELSTYRELHQLGAFVRAGAVLPLLGDEIPGNGVDNPTSLEIRCYAGADGELTLYEDDDAPVADERVARTPLTFSWADRTVHLGPVQGDASVVPERRDWRVGLVGATAPQEQSKAVRVLVDGVERADAVVTRVEGCRTTWVDVPDVPVSAAVVVELGPCELAANDVAGAVFDYLQRAQVEFEDKTAAMRTVESITDPGQALVQLATLDLDPGVLGRVAELLTAAR